MLYTAMTNLCVFSTSVEYDFQNKTAIPVRHIQQQSVGLVKRDENVSGVSSQFETCNQFRVNRTCGQRENVCFVVRQHRHIEFGIKCMSIRLWRAISGQAFGYNEQCALDIMVRI